MPEANIVGKQITNDICALRRSGGLAAVNIEFKAIECGHFLPEENPDETLSALNAFFNPDS
jgi:hypothetical protein